MTRQWHDFSEAPMENSRIIAVYSDGSGGTLWYYADGVYTDSDGDEGNPEDTGCCIWSYLPNGFQLWCEVRSVDPVDLP